jgi:hypothetical protein
MPCELSRYSLSQVGVCVLMIQPERNGLKLFAGHQGQRVSIDSERQRRQL